VTAIAGRSTTGLIIGSGSGDIYRLFAVAQRDGKKLNIIAIPRGFEADYTEMFDPPYMRRLYDLGYEMGLSGAGWRPYPPDFVPAEGGGGGRPRLRRTAKPFAMAEGAESEGPGLWPKRHQ
jgi:hypothetical protein